jgi:hypothetical protein
MIQNPKDIRAITSEDTLMLEFTDLEQQIIEDIQPLREFLNKQVSTSDVPVLHTHMSFVESWRDRISWRLLLVQAFTEHGKSSHFMQVKIKGVTDADRDAYQKKIVGSMTAMKDYLDRLVTSVDSRVNQCKKLLGIEADIGGRRQL